MQPGPFSVVLGVERKGPVMLTNPTEMRKTYDPAVRFYHAVYHEHEVNHCPGCGRTHWLIGRVSAECAFCATALPLAEASMRSHVAPVIIQHKNRPQAQAWAA